MAKTKLIVLASVLCLPFLAGCTGGKDIYSFTWKSHSIDGHRTGVTAIGRDNVDAALGSVADGVYTSPNGTEFDSTTVTYKVAYDMLAVQPRMSRLKEIVAYSTEEMRRGGYESALADWAVDHLMSDVQRLTGRRVDVGLLNFGGIRVDMPRGDVIRDDIESMFPFRNHLCYVALKGSDLTAMFERIVAKNVQAFGGVKLVVTDHKIDTLLVGGKPVEPERIYGLATIDFLLDGGDNIAAARNAEDLIITDVRILDSVMPYVESLTRAGKPIEYATDGRVVVNRSVDLSGDGDAEDEEEGSVCPAPRAASAKGAPKLVILHTNDTHSHFEPERSGERAGLGGAVERAAFVDSVRRAEHADRVLLLHAGDFGQGTSYFTELGGRFEPEIINDFAYDCIALGNHEFDNGIEDLAARISMLEGTEILCANVDFTGLPLEGLVKPCTVVERGGLKIGVIGLEANLSTNVSKTISDRLVQLDNAVEVNRWSAYLRNDMACDMVILLSHIGYDADAALVPAIRGVDLVIGGHSHTFVDGMKYVSDLDGKPVGIITDGCWGLRMGELKVW